jgi:hypothetical protein
VAAFLRSQGADTVWEESGSAQEESNLRGRFGSEERMVEIWPHGSNTGFNDLAWGKCDIAMSSKPIGTETTTQLSPLGDMRSTRNEHVIGLDGIAIIVSPSNPLRGLGQAGFRQGMRKQRRPGHRFPFPSRQRRTGQKGQGGSGPRRPLRRQRAQAVADSLQKGYGIKATGEKPPYRGMDGVRC